MMKDMMMNMWYVNFWFTPILELSHQCFAKQSRPLSDATGCGV